MTTYGDVLHKRMVEMLGRVIHVDNPILLEMMRYPYVIRIEPLRRFPLEWHIPDKSKSSANSETMRKFYGDKEFIACLDFIEKHQEVLAANLKKTSPQWEFMSSDDPLELYLILEKHLGFLVGNNFYSWKKMPELMWTMDGKDVSVNQMQKIVTGELLDTINFANAHWNEIYPRLIKK